MNPLDQEQRKMDPKRNAPYSEYIWKLVENDINALMKQPTKKLASKKEKKS